MRTSIAMFAGACVRLGMRRAMQLLASSQSHAGMTSTSARLYSLVETAKANGLEPHAYLTYVLTELPKAVTAEDIEAQLPRNVTLPATQSVAT